MAAISIAINIISIVINVIILEIYILCVYFFLFYLSNSIKYICIRLIRQKGDFFSL